MKKILIINDNTFDQVNGVNNTYNHLKKELVQKDYRVEIFRPDHFVSFSFPLYKDFHWTLDGHKIKKAIKRFNPSYIHIATEGPLGFAAKLYCDRKKIPYTTAYHTKFPEYLEDFSKNLINAKHTYAYMKWFHSKSARVFVTTDSVKSELEDKGFNNLVVWSRGVNQSVFKMNSDKTIKYPPAWVTCGRVSSEKNIPFFCDADLPGDKIVIGDGPMLSAYKERYPSVKFLGGKNHGDIAKILNKCDVFVFPSLTDTFGIVIIEALACGLPVLSFDVTGPKDIVNESCGVLCPIDDKSNFREYAIKALKLDPKNCAQHAKKFTWQRCGEVFEENMVKTK